MASEGRIIIFSVARLLDGGVMPYRAQSRPDETVDECFRRTYPEVYKNFGKVCPEIRKEVVITVYMVVTDSCNIHIAPETHMKDVWTRFPPGEKTVGVVVIDGRGSYF